MHIHSRDSDITSSESWHGRKLASLNLIMFGCSSVLWFTISRSTFLSICTHGSSVRSPHMQKRR